MRFSSVCLQMFKNAQKLNLLNVHEIAIELTDYKFIFYCGQGRRKKGFDVRNTRKTEGRDRTLEQYNYKTRGTYN